MAKGMNSTHKTRRNGSRHGILFLGGFGVIIYAASIGLIQGSSLSVGLHDLRHSLTLQLKATLASKSTSYSGNTWSVVAVDKQTGDVGVASASCVGELHIDAIAALVPGYGAAATQAAFDIDNRNRVFDLLKTKTQTATDIIGEVSSKDYDRQVETRQYGVITFVDNGVVDLAGFTGTENDDWAGDMQEDGERWAISVQGNILEDEFVVANALEAFTIIDGENGDDENIALSDRLLRALEAGSAAGGDKRCNSGDTQQTASSAFIMVAKNSTDAKPFAARDIGKVDNQRDGDGSTPWLYLTVAEPSLGRNPLLALREECDTWRITSSGLTNCATAGDNQTANNITNTCNIDPIAVPEGGDSEMVRQAMAIALIVVLVIVGLVTVCACGGLYYCCVIRKKKNSGGESSP